MIVLPKGEKKTLTVINTFNDEYVNSLIITSAVFLIAPLRENGFSAKLK